MARPRLARCRLPLSLEQFLQEDLKTPGSFFTEAAYILWLSTRGFVGGDVNSFGIPPDLKWPQIQETFSYRTYAAAAYFAALGALRDLQAQVARARREVKAFGAYAEIQQQHLPEFRRLEFDWSVRASLTRRLTYCPLAPDTTPEEIERWVKAQESTFGFVGGWRQDRLPPSPEFVTLPRYWRRLQNIPNRAVRPEPSGGPPLELYEWIAVAESLPQPYNRVMGCVVADALDWLHPLTLRRCRECGDELPEDSHADRKYCDKPRCQKAGWRSL